MDTYSISAGTEVGNELSKNARDMNSFKISQNAILIENAANLVASDKSSKDKDTEFKVGMDGYGTAEAIGGVVSQYNKGLSQMATESMANLRTAGNKIASIGRGAPPPSVAEVQSAREGASAEGGLSESAQSSFLEESGNAMKGTETGADDVASGLAKAGATAGEDAEDLTGIAKNLTALTGEGSRFGGLSEAGSVSRFIVNRMGVTSEIGVEVGGKALGAAGGVLAGGQDIANLVDTGHIFKKGESGWSEAGNIGSMVGSALDMMSIAVPVLAPLALATNVFSAIAGTVGTEQDDKKQISTDSAPPPQQALSVHPGWSAVGMVASVHSQPSIT